MIGSITEIRWLDTVATFDGAQWTSINESFANGLNSTLPSYGFSASDPHPHGTAIRLAQALLPDLEVIIIGSPYDEEEGPIAGDEE